MSYYCPICGGKLKEVSYTHPLIFDPMFRCTKCGKAWLKSSSLGRLTFIEAAGR